MRSVFIYSRFRPAGVAQLDDADIERHWTYMDAFADTMVARGPTLDDGGEMVTGSLHVVGLETAEAAGAFVAEEPFQRAGLYRDHEVLCFENLLGRTMWQFPALTDASKYLVRHGGAPTAPDELSPDLRDALLMYGRLSTLNDERPAGVVLAVQGEPRATIDVLLDEAWPLAERTLQRWELGGRR